MTNNNNNKGEQLTFTAKLEARVTGTFIAWCREVVFSDRQSAIDYLSPFCKSRSGHLTYKCKIVRSDDVVLLAPAF